RSSSSILKSLTSSSVRMSSAGPVPASASVHSGGGPPGERIPEALRPHAASAISCNGAGWPSSRSTGSAVSSRRRMCSLVIMAFSLRGSPGPCRCPCSRPAPGTSGTGAAGTGRAPSVGELQVGDPVADLDDLQGAVARGELVAVVGLDLLLAAVLRLHQHPGVAAGGGAQAV